MTLSVEDGQLYYKLWLPLLDYINKRYRVNKNVKKMAGAGSLEPTEVKAIADKMWANVSIIDEYLSECIEMEEEYKEIIVGWKRCARGRFILERHLMKGSIMISMKDEQVYQVGGIITSIEEMFYCAPMPLMIEATLLPFRDVIITDGLIMPYNIVIGGNMTKSFKEIYMAAKKMATIHKSL